MSLELEYPIWLLCEIAGISRSSYYKYKKKPLDKDSSIEDKIIDIYQKSNKRAGYRTIQLQLKNKYNLIVNHKKVYRIMKENGIQSVIRKKYRKPKESTTIKENLLNRNFKADKPGEKYVTDITYIPTQRKMMYLCIILDLFNNQPVAWNISDSQDKSLSINTIKALSKQYNLRGAIIHSDQGIHFTCKDYVDLLESYGVKQSMSRKGNCWDNAVAESFFSHYKCESIYIMDKKLKDAKEVREVTEEYIHYYTHERPQRKLGGMPPSLYATDASYKL